MSRRKKGHEDHVNHEAWAIPYGDLITLLLAFFVVMYSISSVNEGKYRVLSDAMSKAFGGPPKSLKPIQFGAQRQRGSNMDQTLNVIRSEQVDQSIGGAARDLAHPYPFPAPIEAGPNLRPAGPARQAVAGSTQAARQQLAQMGRQIEVALQRLIDADMVKVRNLDYWLEVEVRAQILFRSGDADLMPDAYETIDLLAGLLSPFPNKVRVEGHTDDQPITTLRFPSNWELSASRAASVARRMIDGGMVPQRLSIVGLGEHWPISDNTTPSGRNDNRRVTLVILGNSEMSEHLPDLLAPPPAPVPADATAPVQAGAPPLPVAGPSRTAASAS